MPNQPLHALLITVFAALLAGCSATTVRHDSASQVTPDDTCPLSGHWYQLANGQLTAASAADVLDPAAQQNVVLLGEQHTNKDDHRWQLQTLAALHLLRPHMVIGFESFPRRLQPVLDQWVAGQLDVEQFLKQTQWDKVWSYPAELYLPLFQFARINHIPMIALNVDISLPTAVRKHGWDAIPQADRHGISRPAPAPQGYVDTLFKVFKEHAFGGDASDISKTDPRFRHFVQAQTVWDRAMAQALATQVKAQNNKQAPLVVGIMGVGHVRNGYGVPYQLHALGVNRVAALLPLNGRDECPSLPPSYADAVFVLPASPAAAQHKAPAPGSPKHAGPLNTPDHGL